MVYLAHPYSSPSEGLKDIRYRAAEAAMVQMLLAGEAVYSPIAMTHYAATRYPLPKESSWWRPHNYAMLRLASELRVLRMSGWHESDGLRDEIALAKHLNIPITWWDQVDNVWVRAEIRDE